MKVFYPLKIAFVTCFCELLYEGLLGSLLRIIVHTYKNQNYSQTILKTLHKYEVHTSSTKSRDVTLSFQTSISQKLHNVQSSEHLAANLIHTWLQGIRRLFNYPVDLCQGESSDSLPLSRGHGGWIEEILSVSSTIRQYRQFGSAVPHPDQAQPGMGFAFSP